MPWDLESDRPIFAQIVDRLQMDIISGKYKAGEKLPTVRELAVEAGVNPNTMQKAYAQLEKQELVYSQRTNGRYVTENKKYIERARKDFAKREAKIFLAKMNELGLSRQDVIDLL